MDRFVQFACAAARMALEDSGLKVSPENASKIGVWVGSGIGGLETMENQHEVLLAKGCTAISPFLVPMMITNMASGQISIMTGAGTRMYSNGLTGPTGWRRTLYPAGRP